MENQTSGRKFNPRQVGWLISFAPIPLTLFVALIALSTSASCALAQASATTTTSTQAVGHLAAVTTAQKPSSKPAWQGLTPAQQQALRPLAAHWARLSEAQKRKWLAISKNYPSLPVPEQEKLHSRMTEWVSLSPQQRTQARFNFAATKKLSPAEKAATWQAYQALSPEEKKKLAAKATTKPTGGATAVKPIPPQRLATVPVPRQTSRQTPKLAAVPPVIDQNTLLPFTLVQPSLSQKN